MSAPLSDAVIVALARLVDDAQTERRDPSHSDLEFQINKAGLSKADPNQRGQTLGKAKRVRAVLSWALSNNPEDGERLVDLLVAAVRGLGGFRDTSSNFVGSDAIEGAVVAFKQEGYLLTKDGELSALLLDGLSGVEMTKGLKAYVQRAKRGASDAALVTGTGKDLLEAAAIYAIKTAYGVDPKQTNFPTLLGQAFMVRGYATPATHPPTMGESPRIKVERAMYELACAVNTLRNKQGTGHGRPWLPDVTEPEAKAAIEIMGIVAERLIS